MNDLQAAFLASILGGIFLVIVITTHQCPEQTTAYKRGLTDGISTTVTMFSAVSISQEDLNAMVEELK